VSDTAIGADYIEH